MINTKSQNKPPYYQKVFFIRYKFPALFFLLTFIFLFFLFFRLFHLEYLTINLHPKIIYATALLPYMLISLLGEHVNFMNGSILASSDFSLKIIIDCCAIEPMAIFSAAVIAYPSTLIQKIKGLIIFMPIFFSINIIRIVSLYYFGAYISLQTMNRMHLDIWQVLLILFSITFFFFWIKWTTSTANHKTSVY